VNKLGHTVFVAVFKINPTNVFLHEQETNFFFHVDLFIFRKKIHMFHTADMGVTKNNNFLLVISKEFI
jgi:hypothetical protein